MRRRNTCDYVLEKSVEPSGSSRLCERPVSAHRALSGAGYRSQSRPIWRCGGRGRNRRGTIATENSIPTCQRALWNRGRLICTPVNDFCVPSTLKAWIDHIVRIRRTGQSTPESKSAGCTIGR